LLPFERVRLDDQERRAYLQRESDRSGRPAREPGDLPEWPEFVPPYLGNALIPASDGTLWIQRTPSTRNVMPPYDVINRRGELAARISTGKDVNVIGFGVRVVYTVATDDNGIQTLQRRPMPTVKP
jgi:hypothetical protein